MYNNTNVNNVTYINQQVRERSSRYRDGVRAIAAVSRVAVRMSNEMVVNAPVTPVAAFAPVQASVIGAAAPAAASRPRRFWSDRSWRDALRRRRRSALRARNFCLPPNPGKPLDAAALRNLKRASPVAAAKIKVIAPAQSASPVTAPPESRGRPSGGASPGNRRSRRPGATPTPGCRTARIRGKPEPRGKPEQRGKPGEPSAAKAPSPPAPRSPHSPNPAASPNLVAA